MRLLIAQTAEDAEITAAALRARGHQVLAVPLLVAERAPPPTVNLAGAQAFLVTACEGARALAGLIGVRTFPVFADGAATAAELRRLGFSHVETAKDDGADLARLVERSLTPANGALIYACNAGAPANLPILLGNMGFAVRLLPLFTLRCVDKIPAELEAALRGGSVDAALFLSTDEARAFVTFVQQAKIGPLVSSLAAVAATALIAAPLRALKLGGISVSETPDLDAVFATLDVGLVDHVAEERNREATRAREIAERAAQEKAERERLARERADRERIATEVAAAKTAENERLAAERAAQEKAERGRLAQEAAERQRLAAERAEAKRIERGRLAQERADSRRQAAELKARAKAERAAADKALSKRFKAGVKPDRPGPPTGGAYPPSESTLSIDPAEPSPPPSSAFDPVMKGPGEPAAASSPPRKDESSAPARTATIAVAPREPSVTMRTSAATALEPKSESVSATGRPHLEDLAPVSEAVSEAAPEANIRDRPQPAPVKSPAAEPAASGEAKPTARSGGRAARLMAEDAADERAKDQRFKSLGLGESPASEGSPSEPAIAVAALESASQRRGSFGRAVAFFVVLLVMAASVIGTASWWVPRAKQLAQNMLPWSDSATTPVVTVESEIAALKARLAVLEKQAGSVVTTDALGTATRELERRLQATESRGSGAAGEDLPNQPRQLAAVAARLAALEATLGSSGRLQELNDRMKMLESRSAEANSVLALSDRVAAIEATDRQAIVEQSAHVAFLLAVAQWREAILAGHPFALELETVKALAQRAGGPAVDDRGFADSAVRGIPTLAALQRSFGPAAAAAVRASAIPDDTSAWYRRILDRILSIVTVRRLDGNAAGTSTSAILARAEQRLGEGNLTTAVAEMSGLSGSAAQAAASWLADARARVAAEQAAAEATTRAVAGLVADGSAGERPPVPAGGR